MTSKNDENQELTPKDLIFILAIAGRLDAQKEMFALVNELDKQAKLFAKTLDSNRFIYYGFSAFDALSCSYSLFKYYFDMVSTNNTSDAMHDLMMTPGGIVGITSECVFIVGFSLLACHFEGEKSDKLKMAINSAWPYFRDLMKGLKNAYKGWRSTVQLISLLGGADLKYLIVPVGLMLGLLAVAIRLSLRVMVEARKTMMWHLAEEVKKIMKRAELNDEEHQHFLSGLKKYSQSLKERVFAFLGAAAGGAIDCLYLYVGVFGIAVLSPPLLITMVAFSLFYSVCLITNRVYEEYDYQLRLWTLRNKYKLALITKELQTKYAQWLSFNSLLNRSEDQPNAMQALSGQIISLIEAFDKHRQQLLTQSKHSYWSAALLGLKHGIYAYSAVLSVVFFVSGVLALSSMPFPPVFLFVSIALGVALIMVFIAHSLWANHVALKKEQSPEAIEYQKLLQMKQNLKSSGFLYEHGGNQLLPSTLMDRNEFRQTVNSGLKVNPTSRFFYSEWAEVIRSFFSGLGKGQKFIEFTGNSLQEADAQGHYHETPIMFVLSGVSALFFALVLSLRALAKGLNGGILGKANLDEMDKNTWEEREKERIVMLDHSTVKPIEPAKKNGNQVTKEQMKYCFYGLPPTQSANDLTNLDDSSHTILGLS